jgi:hypothetical protein
MRFSFRIIDQLNFLELALAYLSYDHPSQFRLTPVGDVEIVSYALPRCKRRSRCVSTGSIQLSQRAIVLYSYEIVVGCVQELILANFHE